MIIETNGVHLFKIDEEKNYSFKDVKFFQLKIDSCWYEPVSETLIISKKEEPGLL